jgi:hypothetical protein
MDSEDELEDQTETAEKKARRKAEQKELSMKSNTISKAFAKPAAAPAHGSFYPPQPTPPPVMPHSTLTTLSIRPFHSTKKESEFKGPSHMPEPPFRWLFGAQSYSGKSTVVMNLLTRDEYGYKAYFEDRIFIFSRSLFQDDIWKHLPDHILARASDKYDEALVTKLWKKQIELVAKHGKKRENAILLFFDDEQDELAHRGSLKLIDKLFMRGRHANISLIITGQEYMWFPKTLRVNCSHACFFRLTNEKERKTVAVEQCSGLSSSQMMALMMHVHREKFAFLYINHTEPDISKRFFKNFETRLQIQTEDEDFQTRPTPRQEGGQGDRHGSAETLAWREGDPEGSR